ncbi:hypothetical protein ACSBR1_014248 [Camellia fascicularis]
MLRFSDFDKVVIGEVYEQMDTMLGNIKDSLSNDLTIYDLVQQYVVARWDKMNIPLHCLAYVLVPKYYTNSWLSQPALGCVSRKKPHFDKEVQIGYLQAIEKIVVDQNEASLICHQISDFVSNKGGFAQPQPVKDRATMTALSFWHMLLTRYRDDYEDFNNWDAYPEDANIEEDFTTIEQRDDLSLLDSEDDVENNFDDVGVPSLALTVTASPSCPPPSIQESSSMEKIERAQRRLEKAREGRLYQVEYAMEAIRNAGTAIGILSKDGVVLVGEKKVTSKLLQTSTSTEKMYKIDDHVACVVAGIMSDANILINIARVQAQRYTYAYQEPMPVEQLV